MAKWSETGIGIVYFSGLILAVICSLVVILYLRNKLEKGLPEITGRDHSRFWQSVFKITIVFGGLMGAMSVTFHGCRVDQYGDLLSSRFLTVNRGLLQVSRGLLYLSWAVVLWLIFWGLYYFSGKKEKE